MQFNIQETVRKSSSNNHPSSKRSNLSMQYPDNGSGQPVIVG